MAKTILVRRVPTRVISLKEGGKVTKTGLHQLHKGEVVIPARTAKLVHSTFMKGSASKTRKGEKDFTTKKTSKDYDRGGKRSNKTASGKVKRPYRP